MIELLVKLVPLDLFSLEDNAEPAFNTVQPMIPSHSSAQNVLMDSDLTQDYALLLIPSA